MVRVYFSAVHETWERDKVPSPRHDSILLGRPTCWWGALITDLEENSYRVTVITAGFKCGRHHRYNKQDLFRIATRPLGEEEIL